MPSLTQVCFFLFLSGLAVHYVGHRQYIAACIAALYPSACLFFGAAALVEHIHVPARLWMVLSLVPLYLLYKERRLFPLLYWTLPISLCGVGCLSIDLFVAVFGK